MKSQTTDAEIIEALRLVREHGSQRRAAVAAGVNHTVIKGRVDMASVRGLTADMEIKDPLTTAKLELASLRRQVRELTKKDDSAEAIRRVIYELNEKPTKPPRWLTDHKKGSGTPGVPVLCCSDWHYGEVVLGAETGGLNVFNSEIAAKRIKRLFDRAIRLSYGFAFKEHGKNVQFPGIVVPLNGDMISGDIHEELADTNDRKPFECVNELVDLIAAGIKQLADAFGFVYCPCAVGNHGRSTKKVRMKGRIHTSYEWNLYCQLERYFKDDKRVMFTVPNNTDVAYTVAGHRILQTHGDSLGVKGGDGIIGAIGPIMRGAMKVGRSYAQIGEDFDTLLIGHWHQEIQIPGICCNNALKGYDEFARLALRAPYSLPGQNLFFVHQEYGITAKLQVYVDDPPKVKKTKPWLVVPAP